MRIAILDTYNPVVDFKDAGQIIEGLKDLGIDAFFISLNNPNLEAHKPSFKVISGNLVDINFWKEVDVDIVLFISRLSPHYTEILKTIKNSGKKVIVKADSDGTIGYPLLPNYLRILKINRNPIRWVLSNIKWRLPIGYFVKRKLKQIELADAVIFETPAALNNAINILYFWHYDNLIKKLFFIPDPVSDDIINIDLNSSKNNTIISIGRWEDEGCKNTMAMLNVVRDFLKIHREYQYIIIGSGKNKVLSFIKTLPLEISSRIIIKGSINHGQIPQLLSKSKIFFAPSNLESFNIAAAEALCMGCSVVGTPLENFKYLTANGFSGLITEDFKESSFFNALIKDSKKWEDNQYNQSEIADFWRKKLNRKRVAQEILNVCKKISE
ncbi:MAG: glycosyltransferase family 4 protein [Candidatus Paceibacterota bacterium]|jgi:glycosyltransferase involved in cell wall biosynthesis